MAKTLMMPAMVLGAKQETVPGSFETLTATECAWIVFNLKRRFLTPKVARPKSNAGGEWPGVRGVRTAELTFQIELAGGAVYPDMAETFFPAWGLGKGSGFYLADLTLPTNAGSKNKPISLGYYLDGIAEYLYGAMGNAIFHFLAGDRVLIDVTMRGKHIPAVDLSLPTPDYSQPTLLRWAGTSAIAFSAYAPVVSMCDLDLGNDIQMRQDANADDDSGIASAYIAKRLTKGKFDPEHQLVDDKALYDEWEEGAESAFSLVCANGANSATFEAADAEWIDLQQGERNGIVTHDVGFKLNSDDLKVTFSITGS